MNIRGVKSEGTITLAVIVTSSSLAGNQRRTQNEGDGNLLRVFITVHGEFLKQPLLVVVEDEPAAQTTPAVSYWK